MRPASATVQLVQERTVVVGCSPAQARVVHREGAALWHSACGTLTRACAQRLSEAKSVVIGFKHLFYEYRNHAAQVGPCARCSSCGAGRPRNAQNC
jgi:hypothetical protein